MKQTIVKKKEDDMNCLNLPLPIHHNVPLQIFHRDSEVVGGLVIHNVPEHTSDIELFNDFESNLTTVLNLIYF